MELSKYSVNILSLMFGRRTSVWIMVCHRYLQVCSSMHGCVSSSLMSTYACLFLIVSLSKNVYEYFFGFAGLEIQRGVIWYLPSRAVIKC